MKRRYPDELLYSWINRLATTNGVLIKDFTDAYLGQTKQKKGDLPYDIRNGFSSLCNAFYIKPDSIDLYMSTSTLGFESMFMTEGRQTKVVCNIFEPKSIINTASSSLFQNVKICPECKKEDIEEYGETYLHRHHQLTGVVTCYKHYCRLHAFQGINGCACDYVEKDYVEEKGHGTLEADNAYTDYASYLFEHVSSSSLTTMKEILFFILKSKGYTTENSYQSLAEAIEQWKYKELLKYNIDVFLKINMIAAEYVTADELIPLFMFLEPKPENLVARINGITLEPIMKEYDCPKCNKKYITTPYAYKMGFGCTYCNARMSEQEIVANIFSRAGYELKSMFTSSAKKVILYHKRCGQTISLIPRNFIFGGVRCLCESTITINDAKKAVSESGPFELLEFTSSEKKCKIQAKSCGHTFSVIYKKFVHSPQCRICFPKIMTTEYLSNRIFMSTNGEYELVDEFTGQQNKIKILHHRCGQITEYSPRYYHMGAVCPICQNKYGDVWETMYQLLCEYKQEYGHTNISKRDSYKEQPLGLWCQRQRSKVGMTDYRREKLHNIGFVFDPKEEEWNRRFEQYKRYAEEKGSPNISRRTDYEGEHLGAWVETQRKWHATGKMSKERIEKLLTVNKNLFEV